MTDPVLGALQEPRRNKYFYGKLLDVTHLQMEQCYGIDKRWLLNRLALGPGVLCGLGVTAGADGTLCVSPGVAVDGCGREIIVPTARASIDPAQPTDSSGNASGDKLTGGHSTIYLCYTECDAEPTLVYVSECDGVPANAPSTTVEKYRIVVAPGLPGSEPAALTAAQRDAIFPKTPAQGFDRRMATEQTLAINCPAPPDMPCVVLATATLPGEGQQLVVDQYTYRAEVFSNTVLFELIAALADRVDACCAAVHPATDTIAVDSGDNQSGQVSKQLSEPVGLLVSDSAAKPAGGVAVTIATKDAGGALSLDGANFATLVNATSAADGRIAVHWRLGSATGPESFTATLAEGNSATAHATATAAPPVVVLLDPANASSMDMAWARQPTLSITFDQEMKPAGLANPDPWLRAWWFGVDGVMLQGHKMKLGPGKPGQGVEVTFGAGPIDSNQFVVIVLMRGSSPEIVAAASGVALDADFRGTRLSQSQVDALWNSQQFTPDNAFRAAVTDGGGVLPSGDGTPGGYFHAFFRSDVIG